MVLVIVIGKRIFCNNHEDEINVRYCKKIINEYLKYEKETYQWIHLSVFNAIDLETDHEQQMLENTYFEFKDESGNKMREYHINTHAIFRDENKFKKKTLNLTKSIHQAHDDGGPR